MKTLLKIGIPIFILYALFMYEPSVDESNVKSYLSIKTNDNQVNINVPKVAELSTNNDGSTVNMNVGNAIHINSNEDSSEVSLRAIEAEDSYIENEDPTSKTEVSIKTDNPMLIRAGSEYFNGKDVHVDGTGIGEKYKLEGQNLFVNGVKNLIKVEGMVDSLFLNGVASTVRADHIKYISVNGVGNRVYTEKPIDKNKIDKNGVLNFAFVND